MGRRTRRREAEEVEAMSIPRGPVAEPLTDGASVREIAALEASDAVLPAPIADPDENMPEQVIRELQAELVALRERLDISERQRDEMGHLVMEREAEMQTMRTQHTEAIALAESMHRELAMRPNLPISRFAHRVQRALRA